MIQLFTTIYYKRNTINIVNHRLQEIRQYYKYCQPYIILRDKAIIKIFSNIDYTQR